MTVLQESLCVRRPASYSVRLPAAREVWMLRAGAGQATASHTAFVITDAILAGASIINWH